MLIAVEGGGFFSSSASGYSHGLALLLLGRRTEDKTIKASPWTQYCLVDRGAQDEYQLAHRKHLAHGKCASFACFGCTDAGVDAKSPKVNCDPRNGKQEESPSCSGSGKKANCNGPVERKGCLKSSLNRNSAENPSGVKESGGTGDSIEDVQNINPFFERRKVQWTDTCGKELAEIREFEASDDSSDEEHEVSSFKKCVCVIQ